MTAASAAATVSNRQPTAYPGSPASDSYGRVATIDPARELPLNHLFFLV